MANCVYHSDPADSTVYNGDIFRLRRGRVPYFALMTDFEERRVQGVALGSKRSVVVPWSQCVILGNEEPPTFMQWVRGLKTKYR